MVRKADSAFVDEVPIGVWIVACYAGVGKLYEDRRNWPHNFTFYHMPVCPCVSVSYAVPMKPVNDDICAVQYFSLNAHFNSFSAI